MKIVVELNRCQSYGQCVFAAPTVFRMRNEESLEYDYEPDQALRMQVERAAAACPVQAISIERADEPLVITERAAANSWFVPQAKNWVNIENGNVLRSMLTQILIGKLTVQQAATFASQNITSVLNG